MAALASVDDYKARYGEPADSARTEVLLQDASDLMLAAFEDRIGEYTEGRARHSTERPPPCAACSSTACSRHRPRWPAPRSTARGRASIRHR